MASVCSNCGAPSEPGHFCHDGSEWIGKTLDGRYRLESVLGAGGMGMVFRATQTSMNRAVAVKTLNPALAAAPTFFERFKREAEVASRLRHPNVITVFDFGRAEDGTCFIVMELLEGRSLKQLVKDEGPMSIRRAVAIIEQAALGLQHAHNEGCVHRDLKPHNLMVQEIDGTEFVKVLDFGLVKAVEQDDDEQLTSTGQVLGTPQYMPPEQAGGEPVDQRSDLYSLGAVLYYCLTGSSPYGANTVRKALQAALTQPVPSVASRRVGAPVPRRLEEFFRKVLAREKEQRHQSCDELLADLFGAIDGLSDSALDALPESATAEPRDSRGGSKSRSRSSVARARAPGSRSNKPPPRSGSGSEASRDRRATADAGRDAASAHARATQPEFPAPTRSRPRRPWPIVAVAAGLAILGGASWILVPASADLDEPAAIASPEPSNTPTLGDDVQPASATSGATDPPSPAASREPERAPTVEVRFVSRPAGADVYEGETWIGRTPQTLRLDREKLHAVWLKLRGHQPVKRTLDFSRLSGDSADVEVVLEPVVVVPPPPAVKKKSSRAFD